MTCDVHFDSWLGDILKKGHKPQMFVFFKSIWHFLIFRYQIQLTLALRIPRYYGHPLMRTRASSLAKDIKKWLKQTPAITDSRYYRNVSTFLPPSTTFFHKFRLGENNFFALIPCYYGLSLLQTLNLPPDHEGVHNNRSRLNHLISDWTTCLCVNWTWSQVAVLHLNDDFCFFVAYLLTLSLLRKQMR